MKRIPKRLMVLLLGIAVCTGAFCAGERLYCLAEESGAEYKLPILMYHHILKESGKQGAYIISPQELEEDMKYLKENGYTTIGIEELVNYKTQGAPLPRKPVMLTFDDGQLSYMEYVVPLLEKYDMKAVVSVVGSYCNTYTENGDRCVSYAYMNWDDLKQLTESAHTEVQNHTYDMHKTNGGRKGCAKIKGEAKEMYHRIFTADIGKMQRLLEEHTGKKATCFTYPFGYCCSEAEEELKELGFSVSLCCEEGVNYLEREKELFHLKRFNRAHNRSAQKILEDVYE